MHCTVDLLALKMFGTGTLR